MENDWMGHPPQPSRRLAAIMFTDMVGYSTLTQQNEALALEIRKTHMEVLRPIFLGRGGKEIKTTGDGFLIAFASALEALSCAIELQKALREHNAKAPPGAVVEHRIAIHVGDVVHSDDGDVVGDEVNIAARICGIAEGGEIWFSKPVYDTVQNKIEANIQEVGEKRLKGITNPVVIFRVGKQPPSQGWSRVLTISLLVVVIIAVALVFGSGWRRGSSAVAPVFQGIGPVVGKQEEKAGPGQSQPASQRKAQDKQRPAESKASQATTPSTKTEKHKTTDSVTAVVNPAPDTVSASVSRAEASPTRVDSKNKVNWRKHLRVGMTADEVRSLFGEPDQVHDSGAWQVWRYGRGSITLDDGKVYGWSEPGDP